MNEASKIITIDARTTQEPVIVMSRLFEAPRAKVWEAFTRPEHVVRWYGGRGLTNTISEMDVHPGGHWRHIMRTPDGGEYALHFVYVDVVEPEKLSWQDVDYGQRPPGGHPASLITVTLEDLGQNTKWTMVARFNSFADRDMAEQSGFSQVLTEGTERFNEVAKSL
jgi:uncharacterized protein YndB with AHSA1/START domain